MRKAKYKFTLLIALVCVAFAAHAFLPIIAYEVAAPISTLVMWAVRPAVTSTLGSIVRSKALDNVALLVGSVAYLAWDNSSNTSAVSGTTSEAQKAVTVIPVSPTAVRKNPDSTKFTDASGSSGSARNPAPKASIPVSAVSDYASSSMTVCQTVAASLNKQLSTYSFSPTSTKTTFYSTTVNTNPGGYSSSSQYYCYDNGLNGTYYLWSKSEPFTPSMAGYTVSGTGSSAVFNLTDPSAVRKPANTVPCEILPNTDGTFDVDSSNPSCDAVSAALRKSSDGKTISIAKGDGTYDTITSKDDGSKTVKTGIRTIELGPPGSDGTAPINSVTDDLGSVTGGTGTGHQY